jgi:hypothetical protein
MPQIARMPPAPLRRVAPLLAISDSPWRISPGEAGVSGEAPTLDASPGEERQWLALVQARSGKGMVKVPR